jgi:uridine phosphorylase
LNASLRDDDCIIRPRKSRSDPVIGLDAIMVLIPQDLEYLVQLQALGGETCHHLGFFKIHQVVTDAGVRSLCGPFTGAPQAVMGLEKIIALGATRLWVLGWCGSLQSFLRVGDLVIPTSAISEEGTSLHYPLPSEALQADPNLTFALQEALRKKGEICRLGKVWTTDAPYRETLSKVKSYQDQGVLAVEMEMSALMTVAAYRGVKLAGLLVVSDELFSLTWHTGFRAPVFKRKRELAAQTLLGLLGG